MCVDKIEDETRLKFCLEVISGNLLILHRILFCILLFIRVSIVFIFSLPNLFFNAQNIEWPGNEQNWRKTSPCYYCYLYYYVLIFKFSSMPLNYFTRLMINTFWFENKILNNYDGCFKKLQKKRKKLLFKTRIILNLFLSKFLTNNWIFRFFLHSWF